MATETLLERSLEFDEPRLANELFGPGNENLRIIGRKSGVDIDSSGNRLTLRSTNAEAVELTTKLLSQLYGMLKRGKSLHAQDVEHAIGILNRDPDIDLQKLFDDAVFVASPKKTVAPKSVSQRLYLDALRHSDLVFAVGPAGTGKTYLAVAMALDRLMKGEAKRLILTRPAVEAGEKLGFLPGDMVEKVNPYLRPLYDALHDLLPINRVRDMIENSVIEVAPLAFMRGRTLNEAFIILDEAQNTTPEQMKMFLTRMGYRSRAVVTGDVTQIDLPPTMYNQTPRSGLVHARQVLKGVQGVAFIELHEQDVIRNPMVGRIVKAYEQHENPLEERR